MPLYIGTSQALQINSCGNTGKLQLSIPTLTIPEEYVLVEYLESSGTQYINSGITASGTIITEVKYQSFVGNKCIVGAGNSSGVRYQIYASSNGNHYVEFSDGYSNLDKTPFTELSTIKLDPISKKAIINGNEFELSYTGTVDARPLWLFGRNQSSNSANYRSSTKMYYCKMWDGNTLVRNFVPCYRKSDAKGGMYDFVTKQFFTNSGTGEFLYSTVDSVRLLSLDNYILTDSNGVYIIANEN